VLDLFSDLYSVKFLDTSVKPFFSRNDPKYLSLEKNTFHVHFVSVIISVIWSRLHRTDSIQSRKWKITLPLFATTSMQERSNVSHIEQFGLHWSE